MPLVSISQLLGKTIYLKKPSSFFRVSDINQFGDKAKAISSNQLPQGYSFVLDSYLGPAPEPYTKYGQQYAARSGYYWLFYGHDKKYYAVKFDETKFSLDKLLEQGVKTVAEQVKAAEEENKTEAEKLTDTITNLFKGAGSTAKTVLYIGVAVFAAGYLIPKFTK